MLLLTLESSCDETSAAVVRDGRTVLSNIIASQIDVHAEYGGVVPELAARHHLRSCPVVVEQALNKAGVQLQQIDGIVVTRGPGLIGALLVGVSYAKSLAFARNTPLVGVHHIEGHILAPLLEHHIAFPYLALAVSGGHTHLYIVKQIGEYELIGHTLDDAAGEAFDKVAKMCGLGYPGGVQIDKLATRGDPGAFSFPRPMLQHKGYDFSFSGIKTAVMTQLKRMDSVPEDDVLANLAASFQAAVVEVLHKKTLRAAKAHNLKRIVIAGGVACNSGLRNAFAHCDDMEVYFPSPILCADNAAMLAVAGEYYLQRGINANLDLNACSTWPLNQAGAELLDFAS